MTISEAQSEADGEWNVASLNPSFLTRVFRIFAALALLSGLISGGGSWLGSHLSDGGHTESRELHEIVIGNNVLAVPANAVRFERARRNGVTSRLDLYLRWPRLEGYTQAARDDFNHASGRKNIVFVSFEQRMMALDMSGRLEPIYRHLVTSETRPGPNGLTLLDFEENASYGQEYLAVGRRSGEAPFVARCLSGRVAEHSLAPCERDIHIGEGLSLVYRFPAELLPEWRRVDAAVKKKAADFLVTAP